MKIFMKISKFINHWETQALVGG